MTEDTSELLAFATTQAHRAGDIMLEYFTAANMDVSFKTDRSIVTGADIKINQLLIDAVQSTYPDHGVLGEEQSYNSDARKLWVCDPIDGTDAFVNGVPTAMFSLAYVVDGVPTVAVVYEPVQKMLLHAIKGEGAFMNNIPIHVSDHATLDGASIMLISNLVEFLQCRSMYEKLLAAGAQLRIVPGGVFKASLLARGKIDGYYFPGLKAHDVAATKLIVEEAGGIVTDLNGSEQRYDGAIHGAVLSNGKIHDELVAIVQAFGVETYEGF